VKSRNQPVLSKGWY